jgi:hypothetical protein
LLSYRYGILDFCGSDVKTSGNLICQDGKFCFRKFDNGEYSKEELCNTGIPTRHPNVLKGIIIGKKSWGLHVKMWSEGISECLFNLDEIKENFTKFGLVIPESLLLDLENTIRKYKIKEFNKWLNVYKGK